MNIADLIAELQKLPPHLPVAVGIDADEYELCDTGGERCVVNLDEDLDCFGLTEVVNEGRVVRLIGRGMHWETL